ncbi:hypothetical protein J2X69_001324 [Algoriphagus sp. 4150]|uniref:hypothetical protein n=1 Tax=Algoriphagus sp. 4150 TaxID=2817756 RepID=UPI00285F4D63|nr:hypothetical protein [Algoriphagus sp. 4150]MDR7128989.1 hypothetical protein [Algoriphagus sp. 4150]
MTQLVTRLLLALSILFSSGYSQVYALDDASSADSGFFSSDSHQESTIKKGSTGHKSENENLNIFEIEEKDDSLVSFKKFVEYSNYFTAIFCTLLLGYLVHIANIRLLYRERFSTISPNRLHLVIQVFRI